MTNAIFDPVFVKSKQGSSGGARESAQNSACRTHSVHSMPLGNGSCLAQNRTSIRSLGLQRAVTED
jgi:hypothetical protein